MAKTRKDCQEACPAFGKGEKGDMCFDMSTQECQACRKEEPEIWQMCGEECGIEIDGIEDAIDDDTEVTDDTQTEEGDNEMAKKKSKTKKAKGKKVKTAKAKKSQIARRTRTSIVVEAINAGGSFTIENLIKKIKAEFPARSGKISLGTMYLLLRFSVLIGVLKQVSNREYKVVGKR